ncbi:MAG TPA: RHS repeat-associated core domain-containing protein, partial [Flavipsychrobacter sp.]|nr:RHS repeat-associated core domain-containing protein [Flavipsychrobacter sp.]
MGQLQVKQLGTNPQFSMLTLEYLQYEYNIRGWLKAINKEYVTNPSSNSNHFGQILSYDYGFNAQEYNGNIAGVQWRSKGDGEQRAYGFAYDAANRLLKADFTQNNGGWNTSAGIDFSMRMGNGVDPATAYDANGNIRAMLQKGLKLGGSGMASEWIDRLRYNYFDYSNKLQTVTDTTTAGNKLGDFTDKNTSGDDYGYDLNGNMISDKNKKIMGSTGIDQTSGGAITYNHLNLPYQVAVKKEDGTTPKGTITYIYDAAGNKLQKVVHELADGSTPEKTATTTYIDGFIYEHSTAGAEELQFFAHEEGRTRPLRNSSNIITGYTYDYMLKDHLGNVRSVVTEEEKSDQYPAATMETAGATTEEALYYNVNTTRTAINSISGYPTNDTYTNPNEQVSKVSGSGNKIGSAIMLKVMSGDRFNIRVSSWYKTNGVSPNSSANPATELISALAGGVAGVTTVHGTPANIENSGALSPGVTDFFSQQSNNTTAGRPKAYLNWILLNEQFKFVASSSGASQVPDESAYNNGATTPNVYVHQFNNLPIDKNGYLYVYVSNETPNIDVFFDNLQVTHNRGPLLEETHYYPFGLTMAGISSKAAGGIQNKEKFNEGTELNTDFDINWYETSYRSLDPQLGRFWQVDPLASSSHELTPYNYASNNPILRNDPLGLKDTVVNGKEAHIAPPLEAVTVTHVKIPDGFWAKQNMYYRIMDQLNERGAEIWQIKQGSLREMMYRFDAITKHRNGVSEMTHASDLYIWGIFL